MQISTRTKRCLLSWRKICNTVIFRRKLFWRNILYFFCPFYRDDLCWCLTFLRTLTWCKITDVFFMVANARCLLLRGREHVQNLCRWWHYPRLIIFQDMGHVKSLNLFTQVKFYQKVNAKSQETTETFTDWSKTTHEERKEEKGK